MIHMLQIAALLIVIFAGTAFAGLAVGLVFAWVLDLGL